MMMVDERHFLAPELEAKGLHLFDFYEGLQVLSVKDFCQLPLQKRADILLVDTASVLMHPGSKENLLSMFNTFQGVIFFHQQGNQAAEQWVEEQGALLAKIVGEYSLPMPGLRWSILTNQLQSFWSIFQEQKALQQHLAQFSQELDQVLQTAEHEMIKAKKMHELLIPKRSDEVRGVHFFHKYHVGDGGGGEFYDLFYTTSHAYQVLISSQSYLISSALMGILSQEKDNFNTKHFLELARAEIATINTAKKKHSEVELTVLETDLSQLTLRAYGQGKTELYSQTKGELLAVSDSSYQLSKGEKIVVLSPGFIFNWKETQENQTISQFIQSHRQLPSQELLMELFFQLRKPNLRETSRKDTTAVVMEVNRHGIHKV
jgi:hypothetical protein